MSINKWVKWGLSLLVTAIFALTAHFTPLDGLWLLALAGGLVTVATLLLPDAEVTDGE